jgi:hypothetical protein
MTRCDVGHYDMDQDASNGCEYACMPSDSNDTICNQKDDDCDGTTDEDVDLQNDPKNCGKCGSTCLFAHAPEGGACKDGTCVLDNTKCEPGFYDADSKAANGCEYQCAVSDPPLELCNLLDDDCDGLRDEDQSNDSNNNNVTINDARVGQACQEDQGECKSGLTACVDGQVICRDHVGPSRDVCDGKDNDCDGNTDEEYDFQNDPRNCGTCGNSCSFANANARCQSGTCVVLSCATGYWGADCSYRCDYKGNEVCNGIDDDCDGQTDENLTPPSNPCKSNGVCGSGGNPLVGQMTCGHASGWFCDYSGLSNYQAVETYCDHLDNDCDGQTDEAYPLLGQTCYATSADGCRAAGTWQCVNSNREAAAICADANNMPVTPVKKSEVCNGVDDDCDGAIDEPCADPINGTDCARDAWVKIPDYTNTFIYAFEASRPDATDTSSGKASARACSVTGRMPWTNITYSQAQAACAAAGGRLCTEAEWQKACQYWSGSGGVCSWSYSGDASHDCHSYAATTCNTNDYNNGNDNVSRTNPGTDKVLATGSLGSCYREHNSARVYDLSGNVKEWVQARSSGVNPLRGGAMNNTAIGTRCDFNFTLADNNFLFFNAGFRCCYGTN